MLSGGHEVPAMPVVQPHSSSPCRAHHPHLVSRMCQHALGAGAASLAPHHSYAAPLNVGQEQLQASKWGRMQWGSLESMV